MMQGASCPSCGASISPTMKFCPNCGTELKAPPVAHTRYCSTCGSQLGEEDRFCGNCGAAVSASPSAAVEAPQPVHPPEKTGTPQPIARAISILQSPLAELNKVKYEQISTRDIIGYIAVLAVIPAVALVIGWGVVGINTGMFGSYKIPIKSAVTGGLMTYVMSIAGVYVTGLVINALAPKFASKQSETQAMKLAAYAATPGLLGGIFNIAPMLSIVTLLLGLYGLYVLYLGIPVLMETPRPNAMAYTVLVIVVMVVIYLVMGAITTRVAMSMTTVPSMMGSMPYRP